MFILRSAYGARTPKRQACLAGAKLLGKNMRCSGKQARSPVNLFIHEKEPVNLGRNSCIAVVVMLPTRPGMTAGGISVADIARQGSSFARSSVSVYHWRPGIRGATETNVQNPEDTRRIIRFVSCRRAMGRVGTLLPAEQSS